MEYEVGGKKYRSGRMNARTQYHVARRFAPALLFLGGMKKDQQLTDPVRFAKAMVATTSNIPQGDVDYVIDECLSITQRLEPTGPAPMLSPSGQVMYEDVGMSDLLQIVCRVLNDNGIIDVFDASPPESNAAPEQAQTSSGPNSQMANGTSSAR